MKMTHPVGKKKKTKQDTFLDDGEEGANAWRLVMRLTKALVEIFPTATTKKNTAP